MVITEVIIRKVFHEVHLKALVSVTLDNIFAVHDIKIIFNNERYFVAMPIRRQHDGTYKDVVHPINSETRDYFENTILKKYLDNVV